MNVTRNKLFSSRQFSDYAKEIVNTIDKKIDGIAEGTFLSKENDELLSYIFSHLIIEKIQFFPENKTISPPVEETRDISNSRNSSYRSKGVNINLSVPIVGTRELWNLKPSTFLISGFPTGEIKFDAEEDQLYLEISFHFSDSEIRTNQNNNIENEILNSIKPIISYANWINEDIEKHNVYIKNLISQRIQQRKNSLGAIQKLTENIQIPMRKKDNLPSSSTIELKRKIMPSLKSKEKESPNYELSQTQFQQILHLIRHQGSTYELTPGTFECLGEEDLRNIVLAQLNGHFEGKAMGEVFRKNGKTDIFIEQDNRAAFIGECKLWKGEKLALDAVVQLLKYTTWRDVKTSLIFFNKNNKRFIDILNKIPAMFGNYQGFISFKKTDYQNEFELLVKGKEDNDQAVLIHVFIFNLFHKINK